MWTGGSEGLFGLDKIGFPPWVGETPFAATYADDGTLWMLRNVGGDLAITGQGPDGSLRGNRAVRLSDEEIYGGWKIR